MGYILTALDGDNTDSQVIGYWNGEEIVLIADGATKDDADFFPASAFDAGAMRREEAAMQDRFSEEYRIEALKATQTLTVGDW